MLRHLLAKYQEIEVPTKTNTVSQPGGGDSHRYNLFCVDASAKNIAKLSSVPVGYFSQTEFSLNSGY